MILVLFRMTEDYLLHANTPEKENKWMSMALFDNPADASILCEGIAVNYSNMETKKTTIKGDVYKIVEKIRLEETCEIAQEIINDTVEKVKQSQHEESMISLIKEDLNRLDMSELGKVYKFIRRKIIADIPGS